MAVIQNIADFFFGKGQQLESKFETSTEKIRKAHFQKLYDYYIGDQSMIIEHMKSSMSTLFKNATLNKMIFVERNVTKKIINRTSLAYKYPADRYLVEEADNEKYQEMLATSDVNVKAKQWNRYAKLLDTVYVSPMWIEDHIEFQLFPSHLISVIESPTNYLDPESVIYEIVVGDKVRKRYWSATQTFDVDENGKRIFSETNPDGLNPYGVLPFLPCRLRETEDHWGEGDSELVDTCERASILLTSTYHNAIMQSHGIPIGINLHIPEGVELETTPDRMIKVENVRQGDVVPSLTFAQPQPAIEASLRLIDEMFKNLAVDRGLPAASVATDVKAQSGTAKEMDTFELLEIREDDVEALRWFEKSLFDITLAVWNYHSAKKINPLSTFVIDFAETDVTPTTSVDEDLKQKDFDYAHGLWTPIDELLDEDEGIDEAEALKTIQHNLDLKKQIEGMTKPEAPVVPGVPADMQGENQDMMNQDMNQQE